MRSQGGYRGIPVPLAALEQRVGETVASGTPDPVQTRTIIDRMFPDSIAGRMGDQVISIELGKVEYPDATSDVTAGWAATETGSVAGRTALATPYREVVRLPNIGIPEKHTRT